jgi:hypothetical protein
MATASYTTGVSNVYGNYQVDTRNHVEVGPAAIYVADPYAPGYLYYYAKMTFPSWTKPGTITAMTLTLQEKINPATPVASVVVNVGPGIVTANGNLPSADGIYYSVTTADLTASFDAAVTAGWTNGTDLVFYFQVVEGVFGSNALLYLLENSTTAVATLNVTYTAGGGLPAVTKARRGIGRGVRRGTRQ